MRVKFYWEIKPFYKQIINTLGYAEQMISMAYLTFDYGKWSGEIAKVLIEKRKQGVEIRLMVDSMGIRMENLRNIFKTYNFLKYLVSQGIKVKILKSLTPMHIKMCAVDENYLLTGGSNIGDFYTPWQDTNVYAEGNFSNAFHNIFDYVWCKGNRGKKLYSPNKKIDNLYALLAVPGVCDDTYEAILKLIKETKKELFIRTWYFYLNDELMEALLDLIKKKIKVNILFSKHTRVPIVDFIHLPQVKKLKKAGANIIEFDTRFMHSKLYWNDSSRIIVGSQNLDKIGFNRSFEMCVVFNDPDLILELVSNFKII